ncbi:hypothetical protein [Ideonella alba]|uniref:Uncharacterized protein n=1 Tax=Ideonella alba TaxID=2824118 RepID=A0A940YN76_9BURK|nr:hypothetical protein [Ideonella alba]MBQ0932819.1 hypothetical protein [Ideonella alba]
MIRIDRAAGLALLCALALPAPAQGLPAWLVEAQAREARLPAPVPLSSEDGWLRTQVQGRVDRKPVLQDEGYAFSIVVDDTLTVHCEVARESRDLARLLVVSSEAGFAQVAKSMGSVEARVIERTAAGAVGPHAFLGLQWIYRVTQKGEQRVGALHQFAANVGDAALLCAHDQVGYAKTFETLTRTLTSALRTGDAEPPAPRFREIVTFSVDGAPVGVTTTSLSVDADGDTQLVSRGSTILQITPGRLVSEDSVAVEWVRPDGSLINAAQFKAANGELSHNLTLKRADGVWRASGSLDGKSIDLALSGEPASQVAQALARRQLMARADAVGASTEAMNWSGVDPTRLIKARATVLAAQGADAFSVREELGEIAMEMVLDRRTGTLLSGRMPIGPRTMSFQRIYTEGSF